ncbi:hypothetical protein UH38_00110 [Aliterella atlantica CENA595]|uniref:non-specific serine/threonine protein kinase n=1 Tax=Aliterella atlantica CENA595 TaxID=1618023 RepID=A0A0D8ZZ10_9CYAN|nr:hypothetical protein UH38_00110 [Aliterella atlantica CENA595]
MIGKKLRGRYKIIQKLASGGFGNTYLSLDEDLPGSPQRVVKHLQPKNPDPRTLNVARRLFKQEAELLYRLKHEQIPQLYAYFEENGEFYLVEDYIEGEDLSKTELSPGKQLSEAEVIKLLQDILEVLAFVHQKNIIHRDLNPKNIIRRRQDGKLFLIDFGAVKEIQSLTTNEQGQTKATIIGTPGYMPSEQSSGHPRLSSDVYAVGAIAIQALTGIYPSQLLKDNNLELIWRDRVQVSPSLASIIDRMVSYHFNQRYPSAVEALEAIASLNDTKQSRFAAQSISPQKKRSPSYKKAVLFISFSVGLIAVLFGLKNLLVKESAINFAEYENRAYGITIQYPQTWDKQEISSIVTNEIVEFISPLEDSSDKFQEKLIITVENLSSPLSLDEYTKLSKQQISQQKDVKFISETISTLARRRAYSVVYTVVDDGDKLKRMEIWTLKNFKVYSIIYEAEADKYDRYLNTAEKTIKSLQLN